MFETGHIVFGGVIPFALAVVLTLLDVQPWRRQRVRRAAWGVTAGVGMGLLIGYGGALGVPALPPRNANDWLFWGGAAFVLLALVDVLVSGGLGRPRAAKMAEPNRLPGSKSEPERHGLRGVLIALGVLVLLSLMIWLQVRPLLSGLWAEGGWVFVIGATVVAWLWWWQADALARRADGRAVVAIWVLVAGAVLQLVMLSGSQSMGQAIGGLVAALLGALIVLLLLRVNVVGTPMLVLAVPITAGVLVNVLAWTDPAPPAWRVVAVVAAAVLPWVVELTPMRRWGWLSKTIIQLMLAIIPLTAMLASAAMEFAAKNAAGGPADEYYYY